MDLTEVARLVGLTGAAVVVVAAVWLRGRPAVLESKPVAAVVAATAMLTSAALYAWLVLPLIYLLPRDPIIAGAAIGWIFGGIPLALAVPVLFLMSVVGRTLPKIEDPVVLLWTSLAGIVGCAVGGILLLQVLEMLRWAGTFGFLLVPFGFALFPFVRQLFWAPALLSALRRRQHCVEPAYAEALRAWAAETAERYGTGRIEVLFGPANHANAAAIGFRPFTRFIMLGDGLTREMPEREARAILAHEIAHVLREDPRNQFVLWIVAGAVWVYAWVPVRLHFGIEPPWSLVATGIGLGSMTYFTGLYSRRCELATDRLAAELIEDPGAMSAALERLAALTHTPRDRRFPTHPSIDERLGNLGVARTDVRTG